MSLGTGTIAVPKRCTNFDRVVVNFSLEKLDGKLSNFVAQGGQGYIVVELNKPVRSGVGRIQIVDGNAQTILDVPNAAIQVEAGPMDGVWQTLGNFRATGLSTEGVFYGFRLGEQNDVDTTSLMVDFAIEDAPGNLLEFARWYLKV